MLNKFHLAIFLVLGEMLMYGFAVGVFLEHGADREIVLLSIGQTLLLALALGVLLGVARSYRWTRMQTLGVLFDLGLLVGALGIVLGVEAAYVGMIRSTSDALTLALVLLLAGALGLAGHHLVRRFD